MCFKSKEVGKGKIIILSAPSGTGKSTIISHLMQRPELNLSFSVSATSRAPRGNEKHGVEYYFLTPEEFAHKVVNNEFVEWEEVYHGTCYGTLRQEVERVLGKGKNLIMDIDVKGALNVKKQYGQEAVAIFIAPPDINALESRLRSRNTDDEASITKRLQKAEYEMSFAPEFDYQVVNDTLPEAVNDVEKIIIGL